MAGYKFFYTDQDGIEWTINDGSIWVIDGYDAMIGFGVLDVDVASERRPYCDGTTQTGRPYTPERLMGLRLGGYFDSFTLLTAAVRTLRGRLATYKDVDSIGVLRATTPDGVTRSISALFVSYPDAEHDGPLFCKAHLGFWAPDPFFFDPTLQTLTLALSSPGGVTFPLAFDVTTGLPFATSTIDSHDAIQNAGDVETWPTIRIYGPGTNPTVENETTGNTMALTQILDAGDYIDVNMDAGTVTWFDATDSSTNNIIENMSDASVFYPLARGENMLHTTMSGVTYGSVIVSWYNRFASL